MLLKDALNKLFLKTPPKRSLKKESTRELALSITVLLVDIAHVDNEFGYDEQDFIEKTLQDMFIITKDDIYTLIGEAEAILNNNGNLDSYALSLQHHLNASQREEIIHLLDALIKSDGSMDQYEIKLRSRYERLLGVRVRPN